MAGVDSHERVDLVEDGRNEDLLLADPGEVVADRWKWSDDSWNGRKFDWEGEHNDLLL